MDGYSERYLKRKFSNSEDYNFDKPIQSSVAENAPQAMPQDNPLMPSKEFSQGFSRGQPGGIGAGLLSGGISSGNPYAAAGGLGLMALEQNAKAKQAEEEARAIEAQNRKQQQLNAINNAIAVSKGLSVM